MIISVIVPYKNAAEYLPRCVDSLKKQKGDFEFILVDDNDRNAIFYSNGRPYVAIAGDHECEHDLVNELIKDDDRFVHVCNGNWPGVSGARNEGLMVATGDWITFMDADDEMIPGACEVFKKMISTGSSKVYQTNHVRISKSGVRRTYENQSGVFRLPALPEMWAAVWNKLYEADLLKSWEIRFNEGLQYGEDVTFNLDVLAVYHKIESYAACTTRHYLTNPRSLSMVRTETDLHKLMRALLKKMENTGDHNLKKAIYNTILGYWTTPWFSTLMQGEQNEN